MRLRFAAKLCLAVVGVLLLASCSSDPAVRKVKYLNSGEKYFAKGKYQAAEIQFHNALSLDPRFELAHYRLGLTYLKLADYGQARRELQSSVDLNPQNSDAQLRLTGMFLASQEYQQAQELAQRLLAADQNNTAAREMLGVADLEKHDVPGAIRELRKTIEAAPHKLDSYTSLAAIYISSGQADEAEGVLSNAVKANPQSAQALVALGQFHFSTGRMALAEEDFKRSAGLNPKDITPRLALVPVYLATRRMAEAERVCRDVKTIAPDAPKAYTALGLLYLLTGQTQKAVAEFKAVSLSKPKDNRIKAFLINILLDEGRVADAIPFDLELRKMLPEDPEEFLFEGRILLLQGRYQQAENVIQRSIKSDSHSAPAQYFLGVAQNALGFDEQAKASWTRALELDPTMTIARVALADSAANHGDYDAALRQTDDLLKVQPGLARAQLIRARALIGKGNTKDAEEVLQAVLDRNPISLQALAILANQRIREGRPQTLVPSLSKLVEQHPQNAGIRYWLAVVYFRSKDLANAEASAKQSVALDPKQWQPYSLLAEIHMAEGSAEQAKADLRSELDRNPRALDGYLALEQLYEKGDNWGEAKKLVEKAHQIDPADPHVANNLAYLYLEHGGDVNFAVSLARDARQKAPDVPAAADTLGWAYYKLGSANAAVTQLKESVQKAPHNAEYRYHLGMAYLADGHPDLAKQSLQEALATDPHFPDAANARSALHRASKQPQPAAR